MKLKAIIFFLFGFVISYGQAPLNFSARLNITSVTGSDPYTLVGVVQDDLSLWSASDLNTTLDSIYHLEGSDLLIYRITTISSAMGNNFTIIVDDIMNSGVLPSTGTEWCALAFTTNYQYPVEVGNLATNFKAAIDNRFKQRLDAQLLILSEATAVFRTNYVTPTLSNIQPSGITPATNDVLFYLKNGSSGYYTGSVWTKLTSDNGFNVPYSLKETVSGGPLYVPNLNRGNRFYIAAGADGVFLDDPDSLQQQTAGEIFVFEIKNNTVGDNFNITFSGDTFKNKAEGSLSEALGNIPVVPGETVMIPFEVVSSGGVNILQTLADWNRTGTGISDGVYSPTLYTVSTDTIKEVYPHFYELGDSIVTVSGKFRVNSTAGTVVTSVQIQMPPGGTFNFTDNNTQINGQVFAATRGLPFTNYYGYVFANTSTDRMEVSFKSDETIATEQYVEYIIKYRKK